jgi:hypothetical protein
MNNTTIIKFSSTSRAHGVLENNASVTINEAGIKHIIFHGSVREFTIEQFNDLNQKINKAFDDYQEQQKKPVVNNPNNLPAGKMSFSQAIAFVFKGGGGASGMADRVAQIGEMAKSEMTDEEKKTSDALIQNLKKLMKK